MRRGPAVVVAFVVFATAGGASGGALDPPVRFDADRAHVYSSTLDVRLLAGSPGASAGSLAKAFLADRGMAAATVESLTVDSQHTSRQSRVTHVRLRQEVGGLRVAGAYVKAAVNARGDLVHLIENVADVGGAIAAAPASEEQALGAALAYLHPDAGEPPPVASRQGSVTTFARTPLFHAAPKVERVLIARTSGALERGFLVETWRRAGNTLTETLVGGGASVLATELRTANDSYNVFTEDPGKSGQAIVSGPGAGNAESPAGWLFAGSHLSTNIAGNNVHTYLDANANNHADQGGTAVTDGNFLTAANLTQPPTTTGNMAVAVQNLFYLNNVLHDLLYGHGFVEDAGNFQENNFGKGGAGSDSVNAEAQDGSGTDNANFATPSDGQNPRMQMFLWTGPGPTHVVEVGGSSYSAHGAAFGKPLTTTGVTGPIVEVNDGVAPTADACEPLPSKSLRNIIAFVDRGTCSFVAKVKNAQSAGAIGVIVANNQGGDAIFTMGGADKSIRIGSVMISQNGGATLRTQLPATGTMRLLAQQPLQIDADLDADIVFHEYGHGLTWRMIGGMSGPLAGAIGEGASDSLAILVNGDDRIGEYSASNPNGIRRFPYAGYPNTYSNVAGSSVHDDGEIYAAIMWRLTERFSAAGLTTDALFGTFVDGMNYTPSTPAYEDMRDGMLASTAARSETNQDCEIWHAFAQYGVGQGANGVVNADGTVTITESFAVPAACQ
jgi:extracellular elastinolytic metalloproteinase